MTPIITLSIPSAMFKALRYFLIVILIQILGLSVFAQTRSIRGVLVAKSGDQFLIDMGEVPRRVLPVRPVYQRAQDQLVKLVVGDLVQGAGHIRSLEDGSTLLMLESIDFVGLRGLLGTWVSTNATLVDVIDFDQISIKVPYSNGFKRYKLTYSVAPARDQGWMIFLQDSEQVTLGTLHLLGSQKALIEFISDVRDQNPAVHTLELIRILK